MGKQSNTLLQEVDRTACHFGIFFLFYGEKRVFRYLKIVIKGRTPLSQTLLKAKIDLLRRTYDKQFQEISNYNRRLDNGNSLIGTVISDINLNV